MNGSRARIASDGQTFVLRNIGDLDATNVQMEQHRSINRWQDGIDVPAGFATPVYLILSAFGLPCPTERVDLCDQRLRTVLPIRV